MVLNRKEMGTLGSGGVVTDPPGSFSKQVNYHLNVVKRVVQPVLES